MPTKALVVDDESAMCQFMEAVLSSAGIEVKTMTDSTAAAERLQKEKFDAVFLDVRMPAPDGYELSRQVRAGGFNQKTPIVMMTADNDPAALMYGFEAGASFFLFKPIDRGRLMQVVRATQGSIQREKRRFQRVAVRCKVAIFSDHKKLEGTTLDLSLGGLLALTSGVLPAGSRVEIHLTLGTDGPPLRGTGRVARVLGEDRMGIELDQISAAHSERLQEFLLPLITEHCPKDECPR